MQSIGSIGNMNFEDLANNLKSVVETLRTADESLPIIVASPEIKGDVYNFYGNVKIEITYDNSEYVDNKSNNYKTEMSYEKSPQDSPDIEAAWDRFYKANCFSG